MSNHFAGNMAAWYAGAARARAAGLSKSFPGIQNKRNQTGKAEKIDGKKIEQICREGREQTGGSQPLEKEKSGMPAAEKEQKKEKSAVASLEKPEAEDNGFLSQRELQKAVVMSIILGPPAGRKRKRYEGITGRR